MSTEENKIARLPLLALRGLVQFPGMMLTFDVGRKKSVKAITAAMEANQRIFLVAQKDMSVDDPKADDLYRMGCVSRVRQVLKMPDGGVKVLVKGLHRAAHKSFTDDGNCFWKNGFFVISGNNDG